jgi:UDP-N-acetylmuramyl pentapeptide phosphotransferase/UDP-N-acetylglucosamine-1-phosphate transferase
MHYLFVFLILAVSSFIYLKLADKFNIIDKPNQRSSHTKVTIRGGGILFTIAAILFSVWNNFRFPYFTIGLSLIAIVSFIDDNITLSSAIRFPFQIIAISLLLYEIDLLLNTNVFWVIWLFISAVGFINFFNFMDGINGITGLYSIAVLIGAYFLNLNIGAVDSNLIIYSLLALVVFGFYNFRKKALFFAGDIGSISIALVIIFIIFSLIKVSEAPVILLLIMVYSADALMTIFYRKIILKEKITDPHRHHLYQKLVDVKQMSHLKVASLYAFVQLLLFIVAYTTYELSFFIQCIIFISFLVIFTCAYLTVYSKIIGKSMYVK